MIKIIPTFIIFAFGSVLAIDHLIFDADFIGGKHQLIHHVNFASHVISSTKGHAIRFLHFVPLLGSHIVGDAGSKIGSFPIKAHEFIKLDDGEIIDAFTGFSNCFDWFGFHIAVWDINLAKIIHKFIGFKLEGGIFKKIIFDSAIALADFLHTKIDRSHFLAIHDKGIATTILTLILHKKFAI